MVEKRGRHRAGLAGLSQPKTSRLIRAFTSAPAHIGKRLLRDAQSAFDPPVADLFRGGAKGFDLGVGGGVLSCFAPVVTGPNHLAIHDDDGPDGNVICRSGLFSLRQRLRCM